MISPLMFPTVTESKVSSRLHENRGCSATLRDSKWFWLREKNGIAPVSAVLLQRKPSFSLLCICGENLKVNVGNLLVSHHLVTLSTTTMLLQDKAFWNQVFKHSSWKYYYVFSLLTYLPTMHLWLDLNSFWLARTEPMSIIQHYSHDDRTDQRWSSQYPYVWRVENYW